MSKRNRILNTTLILVIVLSVITATITIAIASVILPPQDDFQKDNVYWNGLKTFSQLTNATFTDVLSQQLNPATTVIFIIGPSQNITENRMQYWKNYAENGGTVVMMDETGIINDVLSYLNIGIRIDGHILLDPVFYYKSWKLPKIMDITKSSIMQNVTAIITDMPSILNITDQNVKILAKSSIFSFLDLKGNFQPSQGDPSGPFPVAAELNYGKGKIIVFSDSDLFINSIITFANNTQLLKNIVQNKAVIVDIGVWKESTQVLFKNAIITFYNIISTPEIKYSLTLLLIMTIYMVSNREQTPRIPDEIEEIIKKHPDWNKELLQTIKEIREKQRTI